MPIRNDLAQYDRLARLVKSKGFKYMAAARLRRLTQEQIYDEKDFWLRWTIQSPGLMKIVETALINGIFSKAHIEKNAALVREKSKILARHGLKGVVDLLEPQILPESFYEKHPNLRGARCDNPCYARNPYYSPCVDQQEVLDHYREAVQGIAGARAGDRSAVVLHQRLGRRGVLVLGTLPGAERARLVQRRRDGRADEEVDTRDAGGRGRRRTRRGDILQAASLQQVRDSRRHRPSCRSARTWCSR